MITDEKTKKINDKFSKCVYYEYELKIVAEDETSFTVNNGDGESVSSQKDINIQFMMINETLGFEKVDVATYQKVINKFDNQLKLNAIKLVVYEKWLLRVVQETNEKYLVVKILAQDEIKGWEKIGSIGLKWLSKNQVEEVADFIEYWKK